MFVHVRVPISTPRPKLNNFAYRLPKLSFAKRTVTTNSQDVKELHSILIEDDFVKQVEAIHSEDVDPNYQLSDAEKAKLKKLYSTDLSFPDYKFALNKMMTTILTRGQTGYGWTAYPQLNPFEKNAMEQARKLANSKIVKIPKKVTLQTFVKEALNPQKRTKEGIETLTSRFKQKHGITIINMQPALSHGKLLKPTVTPHLERLPDRWVIIDWRTGKLYVCVREHTESPDVEHHVVDIPRNWMNCMKRLQWPIYSLDFDMKGLFTAAMFGKSL